jgi:hypothetical protein
MSTKIESSLKQRTKKQAMVAQVSTLLEPKTHHDAVSCKEAPE